MENFEELPKCVKCGETPLCWTYDNLEPNIPISERNIICCDCDRTKSDREAREKIRRKQDGE